MPADLHLHSRLSDGRHAPAQVVAFAAAAGLRAIALTDHDRLDGYFEARQAAEGTPLRVVTGIELSTCWRDHEVHVLGYGFDPSHPAWKPALEAQRSVREIRTLRFLEALARGDVLLEADAVQAEAGEAVPGRAHLARALVRRGHARDIPEAFARYLLPGAPSYVPRMGMTPAEAIALIHAAGGVASLAHPRRAPHVGLIPELVTAGLDALEVAHPAHPAPWRAHFDTMAGRLDLARSGGSDAHGPTPEDPSAPGKVTIPLDWLEALLARRRHVSPVGSLGGLPL